MILEFDRVGKSYGAIRALGALSFAVERSAVVALLGPNGAGKTTALEIALGLRTCDSGEALLFGYSPRPPRRSATGATNKHATRDRSSRKGV